MGTPGAVRLSWWSLDGRAGRRRATTGRQRMSTSVTSMLAVVFVVVGGLRAAGVDSWNQFRGPAGDGCAATAKLPVEWSETKNVVWKTELSGKAWSSPVEADGIVWLTNAPADGTRLSVVGLDAATGKVIHDIVVVEVADPAFCHDYNSHSSPTPVVIDGKLFAHWGSAGTACLDAKTGTLLWSRRDLHCDHHRGPGSSPIPWEDLLIANYDGFDVQYVVALDRATGKTVWKTDRTIDYGSDNGDMKKAYCTPTVIDQAGRKQLVSPGAVATIAYDPRTGKELWTVRHDGYNAAIRPLFSHGMVVITTQSGDQVVAVRPDGSGDVTKSHVVWKLAKSAPSRPGQVIVEDHMYMVSDTGIFSCVDLATGQPTWTERRTGRHSASLVESGGRIYACDEDGTTVVFAADPVEFKVLAENRLDAGCMASPAVVGDDLVIRTKSAVYRIGTGPAR
jgi:outer membrane protein assembly factor BamB